MLLTVNKLTLNFEEKNLFEKLSFNLDYKDKLVILGRNGSGKTTLLKTIFENTRPEIVLQTKKISYLPQFKIEEWEKEKEQQTVMEYLETRSESWWEILDEMEKIFGKTELDLSLKLNSLSGGELTKLLLSCCFYEKSEFLILYEPTNHLDIKTLNSLLKYLLDFKGGLIFVSHNLDFTKKLANKFLDLNTNPVGYFSGNFDEFESQKENILNSKLEKLKTEKKKIKKITKSLENKIVADIKGRGMAIQKFEKRSIDKFQFTNPTKFSSRLDKVKTKFEDKILESKEQIENYKTKVKPVIKFTKKAQQISGNILKIENADLEIEGKSILENVDFKLKYGQRLGIIGSNGSGKSSFIKTTFGLDKNFKLVGKNLEYELNILPENIAYLDQNLEILKPYFKFTVIDLMMEINKLTRLEARHQLMQFRFFSDSEVIKTVENLSGGEKVRLALSIILTREISVLILDELSNNLDFESVEEISSCLETFEGSIVLITHDLALFEKLGVERVYEIEGKRLAITV